LVTEANVCEQLLQVALDGAAAAIKSVTYIDKSNALATAPRRDQTTPMSALEALCDIAQ